MKHFLVWLPALALAACGDREALGSQDEASGNLDGTAFEVAMGQEFTGEVSRQHTEIEVRAIWMRPHPGGRDVTAAYAVLNLTAGTEDLLESVRIDGAERVELHGHIIGEGGVMRMVEIGPQRISDAGPLIFGPGGRHFMVFGLPTVEEGDAVTGVLVFQNAGEVPVTFPVRSMPVGQVTEY